MKIINTSLFLFFFQIYFLFITQSYAQDSLYLVGTITGESYDKRIYDVKSIGDVNGDGFEDFITAHYFDKSAALYFGSINLDLTPDIIFHYPNSEDSVRYFGIPYKIGDVNNDGYDDFVITGTFLGLDMFPKGKVFLYLGGEIIDTIPAAEFYESWIEDSFGETVGVGDINKDGYDDFVICSPYNWTSARGYVYLFWGGDTISWERSLTFTSPQDTIEDFFGSSAANIGDINNDGFDDIAIGATVWTSLVDTAKVYIFYGGEQMNIEPDTFLTSGNAADEFGRIIKNAGDLNNDGLTDFIIAGYPYIYTYIAGINPPLIITGYSLDAEGDINNDGYSDFIVGNNWKIIVYLGSENFNGNDYLVINDDDSLGFTLNINIAKDLNSDGFDELFALSPNWPFSENAVGKVFIYSFKKIVNINEDTRIRPYHFELYQNYPNPFNPSTMINYQLSFNSQVMISVYDVLGRKITTLVNQAKSAGNYKIEFDVSKYNLSSGVYFCELTIKGDTSSINGVESQRIKMLYIK